MPAKSFLIVNRAQVLAGACSACNGPFASSPTGDKALVLTIGKESRLLFCATCGDNIMSRLLSDEVKDRYGWDWAVPLRDEALVSQAQ